MALLLNGEYAGAGMGNWLSDAAGAVGSAGKTAWNVTKEYGPDALKVGLATAVGGPGAGGAAAAAVVAARLEKKFGRKPTQAEINAEIAATQQKAGGLPKWALPVGIGVAGLVLVMALRGRAG